MKNLNIRQPRKSMLGTRKMNRESIIPSIPDLTLPTPKHNTSIVGCNILNDKSFTNEEPRSSIVSEDDVLSIPSEENKIVKNDSVLHILAEDMFRDSPEPPVIREKPESPLIHRNVPIREMLPSCALDSNDNTGSFIENETVLANEESVLATTINETTVTNENTFLATTLKDITNTSMDFTKDEATLLHNPVSETNEVRKEEDDMLFKMLDLMNTWVRRNTDSIEVYEKEIAELQKKVAQANEEIENMKNLKRTLIKQFSTDESETENQYSCKTENKPMATIIEDSVFKSPVVSSNKTYIEEMRSTIKFMKTPLTSRSRPQRPSMMLTPHSMSFCLKNQYEQLIE